MKVSTFLSFILMLTLGWMQFYASVRERFNGVQELKAQVAARPLSDSASAVGSAACRVRWGPDPPSVVARWTGPTVSPTPAAIVGAACAAGQLRARPARVCRRRSGVAGQTSARSTAAARRGPFPRAGCG